MRVAVVGGGIAGLMAAYELHQKGMDFQLFEAASYLGGHVKTRRFAPSYNPIELGVFMHDPVFIHPIMNQYAKNWGIKVRPFDLTVSFTSKQKGSCPDWTTEAPYKGKLRDLYVFFRALKESAKNGQLISNAKYLWKLNSFVKKMSIFLEDPRYQTFSLKDYINENPNHKDLVINWMIPHLMCWWGVTKDMVLKSSFAVVVDSMWKVSKAEQYIFEDGWDSLIKKISEGYKEKIFLEHRVDLIERVNEKGRQEVRISCKGKEKLFDAAVIACTPQRALDMIIDPCKQEQKILNGFDTCDTTVYLHRDKTWMPKRPSWSTINFVFDERGSFCSFWPGRLFKERDEVFLSWGENLQSEPALVEERVVWPRTLPTVEYTKHCRQIQKIQGKNKLWFCGAHVHALDDAVPSLWHENAFRSGIKVAREIYTKKL